MSTFEAQSQTIPTVTVPSSRKVESRLGTLPASRRNTQPTGRGNARPRLRHELAILAELVRRGGPEPSEYSLTADCFRALDFAGVDSSAVAQIFAPTLTTNCIHGFAHAQPRGYAGDFEIIDRIYIEWVSADPQLAKWDRFFHTQAAPRAVRNRKTFFLQTLRSLEQRSESNTAHVLNVACGPARDLAEYFSAVPDSAIRVLSLDLDANAIHHAQELCHPYANHTRFLCENVLRYTPTQEYDLVWSAGLFDYFSDRLFVRLTSRLLAAVRPGGELVIGNFSLENPSRAYMELLGRWVLNHRSPEQLLDLAKEAGARPEMARVENEPEGVNLFLRITKPVA